MARYKFYIVLYCIVLYCIYHRETALQGALVLVKSGRLELQDNISRTL